MAKRGMRVTMPMVLLVLLVASALFFGFREGLTPKPKDEKVKGASAQKDASTTAAPAGNTIKVEMPKMPSVSF